MSEGLRVAADIGGTFTDLAFIARDGMVATRKVPSTPGNYADAVIRGINELMPDWKEKGAPLEKPVDEDHVLFFTKRRKFALPITNRFGMSQVCP